MLEQLARSIIALSGFWIIYVGALMLFAPLKALTFLGKAGSTNLINYTELILRLIWGAAMWYYAAFSPQELFMQIFGGFVVLSSLVLLCIPKQWHATFSKTSAKQIRPELVPWLSPFAFALGCYLWTCIW